MKAVFNEMINSVRYYDIHGARYIALAKFKGGYSKGDFFNVYTETGRKYGCKYDDESIETSIEALEDELLPEIGDTVEYDIEEYTDQTHTAIHTIRCTAKVLDVFENGDIRTDRDGVRTASEYTVIKKGVVKFADPNPFPEK